MASTNKTVSPKKPEQDETKLTSPPSKKGNMPPELAARLRAVKRARKNTAEGKGL